MSLNLNTFTLYLVRHGETAANKARVIQGRIEVCLNIVGRKQAELLGEHFQKEDVKFNLIYTSKLSRAVDTCVAIVGKENQKNIKINKLLIERGFGKSEGRPLEDYYETAKSQGFSDNISAYTPKGAERQEAVYERVKSFFKNHLMHDIKPNYKVLIVSHGGVIREFHRYFQNELKLNLSGLKPFVVTPNTGVNIFRFCYKDKKLMRGECLEMHLTNHLTDFDFTAIVDNEDKFDIRKVCVKLDDFDTDENLENGSIE